VIDAGDIVHQIEYRWHDTRDLSPIASTMSAESQRSWDSWIRTWVRHPHVDGLRESLCYQIHSNGRAALAWRYEGLTAAAREDSARGRALHSRVLASQASTLTPEVAIVLCRTGLPATVDPRPGQVTAESELSLLRADQLSTLVSQQMDKLDEEAAQQEGLSQVVASALRDPLSPLAIHIRDAHILLPPAEGPQSLLLWGLRRVLWPVVGTVGRGWSFSTFEPPLGGDVDPTALPAILFRQIQDVPLPAPSRPRNENKSRPFDPVVLEDASNEAKLAGWLVAEYRERGGVEFEQLIAHWCGTDPSLQHRRTRIYEELRAVHAPSVFIRPSAPPVTVPSVALPSVPAPVAIAQQPPAPDQDRVVASQERIARDEVAWVEPAADDYLPGQQDEANPDEMFQADRGPALPGEQDRLVRQGWPEDRGNTAADPYAQADQQDVEYQTDPREQERPGAPERAWRYRLDHNVGQVQREGKPPELTSTGPRHSFSNSGRRPESPPSVTISDLLKKLPAAADAEEFQSILRAILHLTALPDFPERVKSRREVSKPEWYGEICEQFFEIFYSDTIGQIFQLIIVPDLEKPDVMKKIAEWAEYAQPGIIAGLLEAARQSGDGTWQTMMRILQPKLAYRWMRRCGIQELWDPSLVAQPASDSGRGLFGLRKRN
jgi:hypothetical protein